MPDRAAPPERAAEIEITDEMVRAGMAEISGHELLDAWEGYLDRAELVRAIFRAMSAARLP